MHGFPSRAQTPPPNSPFLTRGDRLAAGPEAAAEGARASRLDPERSGSGTERELPLSPTAPPRPLSRSLTNRPASQWVQRDARAAGRSIGIAPPSAEATALTEALER